MKMKKLIVAVLAATLTLGTVVSASAATKTVNLASSGSKAKTFTKAGSYTLKNKNDYKYGWMKFKIPKTGTYKFTYTGLTYADEKTDRAKSTYLDDNATTSYNKEISIAIQSGSDKSGWEDINFGSDTRFTLVNERAAVYAAWLNGNYDSLKDAATACSNGEITESKLLEYLDGKATTIELTVTAKKGTVLRLYTQGDAGKTSCSLKIKKTK